MSEKAPSVETETSAPDPYEGMSRETLDAIAQVKASVDKDSSTPYADLRTALRETLEASGDERAFRRIHNMDNLELNAFVDNADVESKNRRISELQSLIDAYDNNESFADRRTAIRDALEAAGNTAAFRAVYDMNNLELTTFVNDARQKLLSETHMDEAEALDNAYDEYREREGAPYDVDKGRIKDPEVAHTLADFEDITRVIQDNPEAAAEKARDKLRELREILVGAGEAGQEDEPTESVDTRTPEVIEPIEEDSNVHTPEAVEPIAEDSNVHRPEAVEPLAERTERPRGAWWQTPIIRAQNALESFANRLQGSEKSGSRWLVGGVLGAIAVAGAYLYFRNGTAPSAPSNSNALSDAVTHGAHGGIAPHDMHSTIETPNASNTVHYNEGWDEVMQNNKVDPSDWSDRLRQIGPDLAKKGWAYFDKAHNEWRISHTGQLPQDVLNLIKNGK